MPFEDWPLVYSIWPISDWPSGALCQPTPTNFADPPHSEAYLRRRTQPALTVWTSAEAAEWERRHLHAPGSRVDHWPATGHYLHEERPERTIALIREWAGRDEP
jgi:pimeloyl-ACP methyl ester carboxylesterase